MEAEKKNKGRGHIKRQNLLQTLLVMIIIVLVNLVASFKFARVDLTAENRYTLSSNSKELLANLKDVVYVKIYLEGNNLPVGFKRLSNAIREMLDEFRAYSDKNIEYEFINPSESPDKKTRSEVYKQLYQSGLDPTNLKEKDDEGKTSQLIIFPGAIMSYRDAEVAVNFLKSSTTLSPEQALNNSIQDLEYELSNAIRKLNTQEFKKIGFIEGHGELDKYQVGDITKALAEFYIVDRVKLSGHLTNIYEIKDYETLIIAKPDTLFNNRDKFILDQYIMNGGKVIWFLDFVHVSLDSLQSSDQTMAIYDPLNLDDQLFRYGARINPDLALDIQCAAIPVPGPIVGAQTKYAPAPWYYFPLLFSSGTHPINRNLNVIKCEFPSTIDSVGEDTAIMKTFLLQTSKYSKVINAPARVSLDVVRSDPDPRQFRIPPQHIAVLLEGTFQSVFTNNSSELLAQIEKIEGLKFKETSVPTKLIVVSDGDLIRNRVSVQGNRLYSHSLGQDDWYKEVFYDGNKEFVLNAVNYLCDDSGLMNLRSREIKLRMLDRKKILEERIKWQIINVVLPLVFVIICGLLISFLRKRKYVR